MWRLSCFVLLTLRVHSAASEKESYRWQHSGSFYFAVSSDTKNWTSARTSCKKAGGDLAILDSKAKYEAVLQKLDNRSSYWIGLLRCGVDTWKWVDGSDVSYSKWGDGQPSNSGGNENCGHLLDSENMTWDDIKCDSTVKYICGQEAFLRVPESSVIEVIRGGSLSLMCNVSGFPQPNITWYESCDTQGDDVIEASNVTLSLRNIMHTNRSYQCRSSNGNESKTACFRIVVTESPKSVSIKAFVSQETPSANLGDEIILTCDTAPPHNHVNYTWSKKGRDIGRGAQIKVRLKSEGDFGEYKCVATNKAGSKSGTVTVVKKELRSQIPSFLWIIIGSLSATVLLLLLVVMILCRKVRRQKSFKPINTGLEQDEENIPMQNNTEDPQDSAPVYTDLIPRQGGETGIEDTRPVYVNTAPRDPGKSLADPGCLYERLQPSNDDKKKARTPTSPKYENMANKPFKYTL